MRKMILALLIIPFISNADISTAEYFKCIKENVLKYSETNEQAGDIASASVTSCGKTLVTALNESAAFVNASSEEKMKFINSLKEQGKEAGIKYAMDEKLKNLKQ